MLVMSIPPSFSTFSTSSVTSGDWPGEYFLKRFCADGSSIMSRMPAITCGSKPMVLASISQPSCFQGLMPLPMRIARASSKFVRFAPVASPTGFVVLEPTGLIAPVWSPSLIFWDLTSGNSADLITWILLRQFYLYFYGQFIYYCNEKTNLTPRKMRVS